MDYRQTPPGLIGDPDPTDRAWPEARLNAWHFVTCGQCGRVFDSRVLDEAVHHSQPGHQPE